MVRHKNGVAFSGELVMCKLQQSLPEEESDMYVCESDSPVQTN